MGDAHDSWRKIVKNFKDPSYEFNPYKKENRLKLAGMRYEDLSEEEKEKDRYIVHRVIEEYIKKKESIKVIVKHPKSGKDVLFDFYYADPSVLEYSYRLGEFDAEIFALDYLNRVIFLDEEGHYYEGEEFCN